MHTYIRMDMGKLVIVMIGLCVFPALVSAESEAIFKLSGRVFCDECRANYETSVSPGIEGAEVKIECKERNSGSVKFVAAGVTNSTGFYNILVVGDRGDDICVVKLVSSPLPDCNEEDPYRSSSSVILTNSNGLCSKDRFANALGYLRFQPISGCTEIRKQYENTDE